jgi:hypothetical protein
VGPHVVVEFAGEGEAALTRGERRLAEGVVVQDVEAAELLQGGSNCPCPVVIFSDVALDESRLAAILLDVNNYTEWAYATRKSELIKKLGPDKLIYYSEIEVPWPATDRYFYAGFELKKDPAGRSMQVISSNMAYDGPVPKDLVKIPYSKGSWNVTQGSKKSIHVEYTLELDPGGSLPAWILNLFSSKGPLETFENIKKKMVALNPG